MPATLSYPGVYIEEVSSGVRTIVGVPTSVTAFIGRTKKGPANKAVDITSWQDFERIFGGLWAGSKLPFAVRDFYLNGGARAVVVRLFQPTFEGEDERKAAHEAADALAVALAPKAKDIKAGSAALLGTEESPAAESIRGKAKAAAKESEDDPTNEEKKKIKANNAAAQKAAEAFDKEIQKLDNAADRDAIIAAQSAGATNASALKFPTTDERSAAAEGVLQMKDAVGLRAKAIKAALTKLLGTEAAEEGSLRKAAATAAAKAESEPTKENITAAKVAAARVSAAEAAERIVNRLDEGAADKDGKPLVTAAVEEALAAADAQDTRQITVDSLTFEAASPGKWAGLLQVLASKRSDSSFDLRISELAPGGAAETFLNVAVAKDSARRVDKVLEHQSNLLRWKGDASDAPAFPDFSKGIAVDPTNKPTDKQLGDTIGLAYLKLLQARNLNPDPLTPAVLAAKTEFENAKKAAWASVTDGNLLTKNVFLADGDTPGISALDQLYARDGLFNLLCIPPYMGEDQTTVDVGVITAAASYCEEKRAMLLVDPPPEWASIDMAVNGINADPDQVGTRSKNAALFFPRIEQQNPFKDDQIEQFAPCGMMAGIFARTDTARGVWKAPAGIEAAMKGANSLSVRMTDLQNGLLNPLAINCLRHFPVYGKVVWGSRTLQGADGFASEWKYVPVRRTALFIEESLFRGTKWVVFEPNDEPLWSQIRLAVGSFLHSLFRQGAFQGKSPRDAYFVKCDSETTTQNDINLGIVNIHVGFAPLKPCEFVVIQLQQMAGQIEV